MICINCHKEINENIAHDKDLCFTCTFWTAKLALKDLKELVVINNNMYAICDGKGYLKGFSGRKFNIQLSTGEIVATNDLWHYGAIPEEFQPLLPNNAVFVK